MTFAVAGAGKTRSLVEQLRPDSRALVITYTNNTQEDLCRRVIEKFGFLPRQIAVLTYFSFLNQFCYRPLLFHQVQDRGISFTAPSKFANIHPLTDIRRYMDGGGRLYHNRLAKLVDSRGCLPALRQRIERYYDSVLVDEVQDFGGHDFNLLMDLTKAQVAWHLVGDFYQHTFSTSRDGNVNAGLHDDYGDYRRRFASHGFKVDIESLSLSHRCSSTVCEFVRDHIGVQLLAASARRSKVEAVETQAEVDRLHADSKVLKLFYSKHDEYACHSLNWGGAKGLDHYEDVCVVLSAENWKLFSAGRLKPSATLTRNKLYVACSRPRRDLYFAAERMFKKFVRCKRLGAAP